MSCLKSALSILVLLLALAAPGLALACTTPENLSAVRAELIRSINAERKGKGIAGLAVSAQLGEAAQKHACDNARRSKMSHTGSDGSNFGTRIKRTGYRFGKANENVGFGFRDPAAMVAAWMGSDGHRKNILARGTREIGVGVATGGDGKAYWVMVSAGP